MSVENKLGEFNEVYIRSKMMTHLQAPEIDSACGRGQYVYEVSETPQGEKFAVRADSLYIHPTKR
jgi:DNA topoisomerase IB